jgi:hypothetical protein
MAAGIAVVAAAAAVGLSLSRHPSPRANVVASVNRAIAGRTADVTLTVSGQLPTGEVTASGSGLVDFASRSLQLELSVAGQQLQVIYADGNVYEALPGLTTIAPGKAWVSLNPTAGSSSAGQTSAGTSLGANPSESLSLFGQEGAQVQKMGAATIDGVSTRSYAITFSSATLRQLLTDPKLAPDLRAALAQMGITALSGKVYVDHAGRLVRATFDIGLQVGQLTSLAESLDLSNYGTPVRIDVPASADVVSYQQYLADIRARSRPATNASSCTETVPVGASGAATRYLDAVNSDYQTWTQVTRLIEANRFQYNLQILALESTVDARFLGQLQAIPFTGASAGPAAHLETDVSAYVAALAKGRIEIGHSDPTLSADLGSIDNARAQASATLRSTLGLPPSSCVIDRP